MSEPQDDPTQAVGSLIADTTPAPAPTPPPTSEPTPAPGPHAPPTPQAKSANPPPLSAEASAALFDAHKHLQDPPPESAPLGLKLRYWVWKYCGTLVMDRNPDGDYVMSLGRVSTAALLAQSMWRWGAAGTDLPDSMKQTLWILLAYNLGSKGIAVAHGWINAIAPGAKDGSENP